MEERAAYENGPEYAGAETRRELPKDALVTDLGPGPQPTSEEIKELAKYFALIARSIPLVHSDFPLLCTRERYSTDLKS